jgi:predicted phosphodiesterase
MRIAVLADIHGNLPALRAVLAELDREPVDAIVVAGDVAAGPMVREALELSAARAELASWPISLVLDGVCFCHGSPRRDDENLTLVTPVETIAEALSDTTERLVVGGHTHQQMVRELPDGRTYANAGSVGIPYEGRPGAFWMIVEDRTAVLRATDYDVDAAVAELCSSGFPDVDDQVRESFVDPVDPDWVAAFFEHGAGRGQDPGPPRPARA